MVWGATGGIGKAIVEELMNDGWQVIALSRNDEELSDIATHSIYVDISQPFSVLKATQAVAQVVSDVQFWIYAAGDIASAPVEEMKPEVWNRILSANLTGAYLAAHYSLPLLATDAHLVFVGAVSERLRLPGLSAYAAAKAGIEALAETLRKEQRKRRVTIVRPAAVATPLWEKVPLRMPKDAPPAAKIAGRIVAAYKENHSGILDLT